MATALEATGSAIGFLGGWLRDRLASIGGLLGDPEQYEGRRQQGEEMEEDWQEAEAIPLEGHHRAGGKCKGAGPAGGRTEQLLSGALMVAMVIIAIVMLRRCGQSVVMRPQSVSEAGDIKITLSINRSLQGIGPTPEAGPRLPVAHHKRGMVAAAGGPAYGLAPAPTTTTKD